MPWEALLSSKRYPVLKRIPAQYHKSDAKMLFGGEDPQGMQRTLNAVIDREYGIYDYIWAGNRMRFGTECRLDPFWTMTRLITLPFRRDCRCGTLRPDLFGP